MLGPKSGGDPKGPLPRADIKITYENGEKEKNSNRSWGTGALSLSPHLPPSPRPKKFLNEFSLITRVLFLPSKNYEDLS